MSGYGRGGGRGGVAKRGGGRGGGTIDRQYGRPMRGGPNQSLFDDSRSPDRRSDDSGNGDVATQRFNTYRQTRHFSRSPDRRNRSPSPPPRDTGRSGARDDGNDNRRNTTDQVVPQSGSVKLPKKTENEEAREWKLKLFDADEACRRAEFEVRRAKMVRENLCDDYSDFIKRCANDEANKKPNW